MAKYKKQFEKWGGRELKHVINGKLCGVRYDKGADSYYVRIPQFRGRAIKQNLGRNKGRAAGKWWNIVEAHMEEQLYKLPRGTVQTKKQLPFIHRLRDDIECEEEYQARKDYLLNEYLDGGLLQKNGETKAEYNRRVLSNPDIPFRIEHSIPESVLADIFNKWLEDPYECSRRLGREDIANLHKLQVREPISLYNMAQFYYDYIPTDREQARDKYRRKVKKWFEKFIQIINKTYLDEIVKADIQHYTQTVLRIGKKDNRSSTWISHRFGAVYNVINTFNKTLEDKTLTTTVLQWIKDFPAPKKTASSNSQRFDPQVLTKEQVQEIIDVVKSIKNDNKRRQWLATILWCLNTCSYGVDARDLMVKHLDLDNKTVKMIRKKKNTAKVGILWDETVFALRDYLDNRKSKSEYVFISQYKTQYGESGFNTWVKLNIKSKLSWEFDIKLLRDSGRYAAELGNASPNHIELAMGHRLRGENDAYLFRHPELVKDVAEAIHAHYFAKK